VAHDRARHEQRDPCANACAFQAGHLQIKVRPVYDMLFKNRIFDYFAAATPGLAELVTIGKVWELAQPDRLMKKTQPYDLVIVDAPATGKE